MALNLLKLCVGAHSIRDLESWIEENALLHQRLGRAFYPKHTTRMLPKRADELLDGGSLYWVIKGQICCRQRLLAIEPFVDGEGIGRCNLKLDPVVVPVVPRPYRPFQGWRYLDLKDTPKDAHQAGSSPDMPEDMRRDLALMGLI